MRDEQSEDLDDVQDGFDRYLDEQEEYEQDLDFTCAFPGRCVMPGEHMRSECATAEMMEDWHQMGGET